MACLTNPLQGDKESDRPLLKVIAVRDTDQVAGANFSVMEKGTDKPLLEV